MGLLLIGFLGYYLFVTNNSAELDSDSADRINQAQLAGQQFLRELNEIKTFELSDELFVDQRFRSFVDFTEPVSPQPIGRENPFAPVQ